jgi:anti-anti-sigma factor
MTAEVEIENSGTIAIMHLSGDFNGVDENDTLLAAFKKLAKDEKDKVLIDLKDVVYLNSASIGVLLSGNAIIKKIGGKLALYNSSDYLENTFNVTKLNLALTICKNYDEALKQVNS